MFVEYKDVRQVPGAGPRRWFEGDTCELVVWYGSDAVTVEGFQLLYQFTGKDRALTWREGEGFNHARVDDGEPSPLKNLTPILLPNGTIPWPQVRAEFDRDSGALEPGLRAFVQSRLEARG